GDVDNTAQAGTKAKQGVVIEVASVKEGDGFPGVIQVGDIVVSLGASQEKGARSSGPGQEGGSNHRDSAVPGAAVKEKDRKVLLRNYRAT
ncbi:hypothetical protein A2U01_0080344, partial [Trifolium medium]|nr:hypothetical protein [Trifolium medium]